MPAYTGQVSALVKGNASAGGHLSVQRNTPFIFNAPDTAGPNDIIYVQGDFKMANAQVLLNGTTLELVEVKFASWHSVSLHNLQI